MRLVDLAVALDDLCHSLCPIGLAEVFVLLRLDVLSSATHNSVTLFLDSSFISCHPPLPAGGELAGVWLGEGRRELEGLFLDSRKQLLLLLKEDSIHIADSDSVVLCYARGALSEEENCLQGSPLHHLLPAAMETASGGIRFPHWRWCLLRTIPRHLPPLVEDWWPVKEPSGMEKREGQLAAPQKSWIHPVFAR
jgi:hypothetical protein